jgi:hypothetical protein
MNPGEAPRRAIACLYFPGGLPGERLRALAEACLRLSSQVALRPGEAVFVEVGGSRLLYGEASLRARLRALGARFSARDATGEAGAGRQGRSARDFRLGWGAHAGEAWAQACYGFEAGGQRAVEREAWPLESLECYATPFGRDEEVALRLRALAAALRALGVERLGGFLGLPAAGWGERFGPDAAVLRERLGGRMVVAWPRFEPAESLKEDQELRDVESGGLEAEDTALRFHLKRLCDRTAARLRGRGVRAAGLRLELGFERGAGLIPLAPRRLDLALALPVAEPSQLRRLLTERLEAEVRRRPLGRALERLGLEVTATAPGFQPQREIFGHREDEIEAHDGLLSRLSQRLGPGAVYYAEAVERHDPGRAWRPAALKRGAAPPSKPSAEGVRMLDAGRGGVFLGDLGGAEIAWDPGFPPRPTRLLRSPLMLARAGDWLLYLSRTGKARRWCALDWAGPERLGGEWWRGNWADAGGEAAAENTEGEGAGEWEGLGQEFKP